MVHKTNAVSFTLLILLSISCDESLPVRIQPIVVFTGYTNWFVQTSIKDSSMTASFTIKHDYEEVLDDHALFEGWIDIVFLRDASIRKHDVLTASNIAYAPGYNSVTGRLTFDPRDSIRLEYRWDLSNDAGKNLMGEGESVPSVFRFKHDTTCFSRFIADPEMFGITGQITLYKERGAVSFPARVFNLCFVVDTTFPNYCLPLAFGKECLN